LLLPALERLRVPIPLGGTSNHFRVNILKQVHAWDPFNVTEDADLGLRLARFGFFTQVLHSTTFEEANCQLWNWVKQRTRWVKGYMQTYLVHMRTPVDLWKRVGTLGFIGFQLFVGGTILSNLLNIPMWILSFVLFNLPEWNIHRYFPKPLFYEIWLMNFLLGTVGIVVLNMLGVIAVKNKHLALSAFTAPLYWLLMSLASYRALYQLIVKPSYWDKTEHGISQTLIPD
jgi:cellulose synthase/poly-beta-1,6-N-acetylglucosamine synthase-like glycosyltransferase